MPDSDNHSRADIARLERELAVLRERERDLTDFIENASLGLHWVGPDGVVIWANQTELDLLGYERDEYIGHHISEFHADSAVIDDILQRLECNETLRNYEARLRAKDGAIRHVLISSNVRWKEGEFVHTRCFTRDITERRRSEQRLFAQYSVGHALSTASSLESVGSKLLELIGTHLGWCLGFLWTPKAGELYCRSSWVKETTQPRDLITASLAGALPPGTGLPGRILGSASCVWIPDLRHDRNFPRQDAAVRQGMLSGFGFPVIAGGEVKAVLEFFADEVRAADDDLLQTAAALGLQIGEFLERVRVQETLAEREEGYRALTETASDGIVTIDSDNTILFANTSAAKLFGYRREELIGADVGIIMPEDLRELHREGIANYIRTGKRRRASWKAIPLSGQHRNGHQIPLEISFGEYRQGEKHVFVGILRDTTERTQLEASMRHAAKLESLGVLAGGIAHDFNNLLTGILGNVSMAIDGLPVGHPAEPMLLNAIEASERAADLTRQMLAYAGKGRLVIEPVNMSHAVRQISTLVQTSIPRHVNLRFDLDESLPPVEADASQLEQLVMNLIINGAEAIPEDRVGELVVTTQFRHVEAEEISNFVGSIAPSGPYILVRVSDNGHGIDKATMAKIFDPFFTTKFTGRGLGLAAALGIVRGHNGALRVESTPGVGTVFTVLLPPSTFAPKMATPAPACLGAAEQAKGTVLVVDDEPMVLKVAASSLERNGHAVVTAENGRAGVNQFREVHRNLSLVILDMTMPVMNGEQALVEMLSIDPEVPIVLSSGYDEVEALERFKGRGLAGFLQKPYTSRQLTEKVRLLSRQQPGSDPVAV